jgi:Family of unknown function (DUF6088)
MQTMKTRILDRIRRFESGHAFMAKDFLDIASRGTVDMTLSALLRDRVIRRIRRGLYDSPKVNPDLGGTLSPDIDQTARALARRHRWTIVPEGAWAANLLGLSTQVPAKIVYLSDGPNQTCCGGFTYSPMISAAAPTPGETAQDPGSPWENHRGRGGCGRRVS